MKQSTTTAHNLICSQAVICLPHKNLREMYQSGLSERLSNGLITLEHYIPLDVVRGLCTVNSQFAEQDR